jgi:hypothetical protein
LGKHQLPELTGLLGVKDERQPDREIKCQKEEKKEEERRRRKKKSTEHLDAVRVLGTDFYPRATVHVLAGLT